MTAATRPPRPPDQNGPAGPAGPDRPPRVGAASPAGRRITRSMGLARRLGLQLGVFAVLVAAWEIATRRADKPFFPRPSEIAETIGERWLSGPASHLFLTAEVGDELVPSVVRVLGGWAIAAVIGISLGIALGRAGWLADFVNPLLHFLRAVPPPALLPVFVVLLGLGASMQLAVIVFGAVWPIVLNAVDGARSVQPVQEDTARVFRVSRAQWLFGVVLPAAAPKIFAGLRISLSIALILMVIAELTGASPGLGATMTDALHDFQLPAAWSVIVVLGLLGYVLNSGLLAVEHRVLRWHRGAQHQHTDQAR